MAQCPKCGETLRLYQWRPECPHCGVNMVYYDSNGRLLKETEQAEIEHAKSQPRIDRLKAATIGSPQAIIRLILSVLPLGALFLPLGGLYSGQLTINAISMYKHLSNMGIDTVLYRAVKKMIPELPLAMMMICVVSVILHLFCLTASLGKHGKSRNLLLNLLMLFSGSDAIRLFMINHKQTGAVLDWGSYVLIGLLVVILIYNIVLAKVGLPIKKTPCYIGGLPSDEYFAMVGSGVSDLEIRKKMVEALTAMQEDVFRRAAEERDAQEAQRAAHG